jgi:hypothetical protein
VLEEVRGNYAIEDAIAHKLQSLIVVRAMAAVGKRLLQQ